MAYQFKDVFGSESPASTSRATRLPCPLGDDCKHASVSECDEYRQKLLEEEHRKACGENCNHFGDAKKGIPAHARWQGVNPDEYIRRTRGIK